MVLYNKYRKQFRWILTFQLFLSQIFKHEFSRFKKRKTNLEFLKKQKFIIIENSKNILQTSTELEVAIAI